MDIFCPRCGGLADPAGHEDARAFYQCPSCQCVWTTHISASRGSSGSASRPAPRVLVADDSPEMLELLSAWLEDEGCMVIAVGTGREALQAAAVNQPDVAFLDVVLPAPDGYQLCEMLTQPDGPVVVLMTGMAAPDLQRMREAGGLRLLQKPFSREALIEALDAALEHHRPADAAERPRPSSSVRTYSSG